MAEIKLTVETEKVRNLPRLVNSMGDFADEHIDVKLVITDLTSKQMIMAIALATDIENLTVEFNKKLQEQQ